MIREDFLLRQIKQFAEALARMLKLRTAGKYDEALAQADALYEALGIPRGLHDVVDTPTLASMLRTADAIRMAAQLQVEEGHIYKAKGDPVMAFTKYKRAHELMLEARALEPIPTDDTMLLELARLAPGYMLDPRYRS
jgi:tetratricopeptide (TPR) repeat protein